MGDLVDKLYPALVDLSKIKDMNKATALKVSLLVQSLEPRVRMFGVTKEEILKSNGEPIDGQPGTYKVKSENIGTVQLELDEMKEVEIELPSYHIKFNELPETGVSGETLVGLNSVLIVDDIESDPKPH